MKGVIDVLCDKLQLSKDSLSFADITNHTLHIPPKRKRVWKVELKVNGTTLYLMLFPVHHHQFPGIKQLQYVIEVLKSLKLRFSDFPKIFGYFRAEDDRVLYDVAVFQKVEADLIQNYFDDCSTENHQKIFVSLKALGRALAELHMKKAVYRRSPHKRFLEFYDFWINDFKEKFNQLHLQHEAGFYLEKLHQCYLESFSIPFLTGVIHLDAGPQNLMYDPEKGKIVFLDLEGISLSINKKMEGEGPVSLDFVKTYHFFIEKLRRNGLPKKAIDFFVESYRLFSGKHFPNESHLVYFLMLELIKDLCLLQRNGMVGTRIADRKKKRFEKLFSEGKFWI